MANVCSNSPSAPSVAEGRLASRCLDQCAGVSYKGVARQGEIFLVGHDIGVASIFWSNQFGQHKPPLGLDEII